MWKNFLRKYNYIFCTRRRTTWKDGNFLRRRRGHIGNLPDYAAVIYRLFPQKTKELFGDSKRREKFETTETVFDQDVRLFFKAGEGIKNIRSVNRTERSSVFKVLANYWDILNLWTIDTVGTGKRTFVYISILKFWNTGGLPHRSMPW